MRMIKVYCNCGKEHKVPRDSEIKSNIHFITCNWCPDCESTATDYYCEEHHPYKKTGKKRVNKDQMELF